MRRVRVVKLGGSLLTMPNLRDAFHRWCAENPHPLTLVIVGGGPVVDAVRQIDRTNPLEERFAHWLCIDLLQHTARLAQQILGDVELYETAAELQQAFAESTSEGQAKVRTPSMPTVAIVQVGIYFTRNDSNLGLPASWDVTSDTLAAAFCELYAVEELVVMKSREVPVAYTSLHELAEVEFVDPRFADLAEEIQRVRFINLRAF